MIPAVGGSCQPWYRRRVSFVGGFPMRNPARLFSLLVSVIAMFWLAPFLRAGDSPLNLRRTVVVDVAEKTKNAVVYISTTKMGLVRVNPFGDDPMFAPFSQTY